MRTHDSSRRRFLASLAAAPLALRAHRAWAAESDAQALHAASIVIDHACPLLVPEDDAYIAKTRAGGTTVAMATLASNHDLRGALGLMNAWMARFAKDPTLIHVTTVDDIHRAKRERKLGIGFHFQNSRPVEGLRPRQPRPPPSAGPARHAAHLQREEPGGRRRRRNARTPGLSKFGLRMVEEMNRLGIVVDLSHVGHRTTMEAMEASKAPVMFSHSNAWSVHASKRNIKDDQIKALAP